MELQNLFRKGLAVEFHTKYQVTDHTIPNLYQWFDKQENNEEASVNSILRWIFSSFIYKKLIGISIQLKLIFNLREKCRTCQFICFRTISQIHETWLGTTICVFKYHTTS